MSARESDERPVGHAPIVRRSAQKDMATGNLPTNSAGNDDDHLIPKVKDVIAYCLVIAFGIVLISNFALFWIFGHVQIQETNLVILSLETAMSVLIIAFGLERLVAYLRSQTGSASRPDEGPRDTRDHAMHPGTRPS